MDKLIDKFYNGSMHKFGFGTVGSINSNLPSHKVMTPRPTQIKYNNNPTLLNQNRSQNNINNINTRYNGSQTLFNNPVPKTQYSMGLNVPTTSDPLITRGLTLPYKKTEYNGLETVPNGQTKRYFKPEILKVQMLEQKIKEIEEKSKADKRRMRQIIESNVLNVNPPPNNPSITNNETPEISPNINNNNIPETLEQAMNNLRSQNNGMLGFNQKQALRREQIQKELAQARDKLKLDKYTAFQSKEYSEDIEEEEEEEDEEESDKITNKNEDNDNLINAGMRPVPRNTLRSTRRSKFGKNGGGKEGYSSAQQEANDFIHNIPDHVALKLQADNFKVRANLAQVKDGFRNIRNVLEDKLDALQMAQKINFEKVRFIIEQGGSKKMIAGLKKLIDGEDIDINNIEEDEPEYIKNLPNIIDEKLRKNEEMRREELNREKLEEQQMMDDEIGERFNVTNASALKEFNPDNIKNDNNNDANPWEVINHQTDYQYIPGRGVLSKSGRYSINKYNYLSGLNKNGALDKNFNPYNKRMITEEHENIIVNKIAEKIFKTMKDNNFLTEGMLLNQKNQEQIAPSKEPTKPASKEGSHTDSFSVRDGLDERFSNLAENKKPSVASKSKSSKTKSSSKKSKKKKKKKKKSETTEEEEEKEEEEEEGEEEEDDEEGEEEEDDEEGDEEGEENEDEEEEGEGEGDEDEEGGDEEDEEEEEEEEESKKKKKKKKKKNKKSKSSDVTESTGNNKKKKKKSKSSEVTESSGNNKKKKKKSSNKESSVTESSNTNKKKKKKSSNKQSSVTESEV